MSEIHLIGVSGKHPDKNMASLIRNCRAVAASRRFQPLAQGVEHLVNIVPIKEMLDHLAFFLDQGDVAVLASGDPLFFGIGRSLIKRFGREQLKIYPALSSAQLACSRFREPWDDMTFISAHGKTTDNLAARILGREKTMIFTDPVNSPDKIAALLIKTLCNLGDNKRLTRIKVQVAENIELDNERLVHGSLTDVAEMSFNDLNLMLVKQPPLTLEPHFGLNESEFHHSRGLITKDEIRAITLHQLRLPAMGVFWDLGAGSGSVAVSAARLQPRLNVYAVEKRLEEISNIKNNAIRHETYNITICHGTAPESLTELPDPDRVFIGGSGGGLAEIIELCAARLAISGRIVINGVTDNTIKTAPKLLEQFGLVVEKRNVRVERFQNGSRQSLNPITIITGIK